MTPGEHGRILRLKQGAVSAGLQTILRAYKDKYGEDWDHFESSVTTIRTSNVRTRLRLLVDDQRWQGI